jgi:DNA-binding PadR family transcriptional regulator
MIKRAPKNGAEIMDEIETMSQGWWRPSPGSVYPLLEELAQDGLIKKREDGRFELTDKGREEVEFPFGMSPRHPRNVEDMLNEISGYVSYFEDLKKSDRPRIETYRERIKSIEKRLSDLTS